MYVCIFFPDNFSKVVNRKMTKSLLDFTSSSPFLPHLEPHWLALSALFSTVELCFIRSSSSISSMFYAIVGEDTGLGD